MQIIRMMALLCFADTGLRPSINLFCPPPTLPNLIPISCQLKANYKFLPLWKAFHLQNIDSARIAV